MVRGEVLHVVACPELPPASEEEARAGRIVLPDNLEEVLEAQRFAIRGRVVRGHVGRAHPRCQVGFAVQAISVGTDDPAKRAVGRDRIAPFPKRIAPFPKLIRVWRPPGQQVVGGLQRRRCPIRDCSRPGSHLNLGQEVCHCVRRDVAVHVIVKEGEDPGKLLLHKLLCFVVTTVPVEVEQAWHKSSDAHYSGQPVQPCCL
mmetsp:Transcript_93014/g.259158  ORF Transcript_93014/g.259158 Transcript_93014/m.259158 type:complete len:201 (+) Transcript_93014:1731-2333(+)